MSLPRIEPRPLAAEGTLAADFLRGGESTGLYPPSARGEAAPGEAPGGGRPRLPAEAFGAGSPAARQKLRRILDGDGALVTTGQQPLLFLGPLYVLYKALSAVEAARSLEAATGRPALASFWIASDDHDWREVGATRVIDTDNRLRELRLEPPAGWAGRSAGPAPLPEAVTGLLDDLREALPATEFVEDVLAWLADAYRPGRPLGEAFAAALGRLLDGRDIVWLDAAHPEVRRASAPLVERALREASGLGRAVEEATARVREAGWEPRIAPLPGAAPVFFDTGEARVRVRVEDGTARLGEDGRERPLEALLERLREEPGRFGPNVELRPALESWLLPVAATVLGPGELEYWAQLPDLFARLDVPVPALLPRGSWSLVETKVDKVLEKLGAGVEDVADGGEALAERHVREARPPDVEAALEALRAGLGRELEAVEGAVESALPGIRSAVGKARSQAFRAVSELEQQVDARLRERREVVLEQIRKAALHLFPDGSPQERVSSPFYYLARYGPALVEALVRRTREDAEISTGSRSPA